jgi:hypothetical protein
MSIECIIEILIALSGLSRIFSFRKGLQLRAGFAEAEVGWSEKDNKDFNDFENRPKWIKSG